MFSAGLVGLGTIGIIYAAITGMASSNFVKTEETKETSTQTNQMGTSPKGLYSLVRGTLVTVKELLVGVHR